jgi:flagellar protein FlaG
MASVSSSTLILFIASILVAASVAGTMTNGVSRLSDALGDRSIDVSNEIRTDIDVISDPGSDAVYSESNGNVTLLLKNTGSQTLSTDPDTLDIIIDGQYATAVSTRVVGEDTDWEKGAVLEVEIDRSLDAGSHRAVVIVNDHRETFEFRV